MNTIASDTLVEAVARGIAKAKGIEICSDASYRHSTFGPLAQAALTAITEAGYAVVPVTPDVAMIDAGDEVMMNRYGCSFEPGPVYRAMVNAAQAPHIMPPPMRDSGPLESEEGE